MHLTEQVLNLLRMGDVREATKHLAYADKVRRKKQLLYEAGYFTHDGWPIESKASNEIWNRVCQQLEEEEKKKP